MPRDAAFEFKADHGQCWPSIMQARAPNLTCSEPSGEWAWFRGDMLLEGSFAGEWH